MWVRPGLAEDFGNRSATIWQYEEWELENPSWDGNPFDVVAEVTATHTSGAKREFEMFYDGGTSWKFRFTGDITGDWSFSTSSSDGDLDGHTGTVSVAPGDENALGFNTAEGQKYVWQYGNDGAVKAQVRTVYGDRRTWFWARESPSDDMSRYFKKQLDDAEDLNMDAVWICFRHCWFKWGAWSGSDHTSQEPDLQVFRMLENHIQEVHSRGLSLDIRLWGDAAHDWSAASLPGGINGEVDRRLQRYIAARLGALPGWGLSYAFDLEEFMDNGKCDAWADYLNERFAWPHLIWTRRYYGGISVTVASNDDRPGSGTALYGKAVNRLTEGANGIRPVLFERNFEYCRDNVWCEDNVRRGMWSLAMAGGVSAHWTGGNHDPQWNNKNEIRTFGEFWTRKGRLLVDMERKNSMSSDNDTRVLFSEGSQCVVAYRENTDKINLDLTGVGGSRKAVAVDAKSDYEERALLSTLSASDQDISLPYPSDWAVAVGDFQEQNPTRSVPDRRHAGVREQAGGVRALVNGPVLRLTGLDRHRVYTITLSDARGMVSSVRKDAGSEGIVWLSIPARARGVHFVSLRGAERRSGMSVVVP